MKDIKITRLEQMLKTHLKKVGMGEEPELSDAAF
jgi:hypothetical protein